MDWVAFRSWWIAKYIASLELHFRHPPTQTDNFAKHTKQKKDHENLSWKAHHRKRRLFELSVNKKMRSEYKQTLPRYLHPTLNANKRVEFFLWNVPELQMCLEGSASQQKWKTMEKLGWGWWCCLHPTIERGRSIKRLKGGLKEMLQRNEKGMGIIGSNCFAIKVASTGMQDIVSVHCREEGCIGLYIPKTNRYPEARREVQTNTSQLEPV